MRTVWKFPLASLGGNEIAPPAGAVFRYVAWDPSGNGAPAVWFEVDPDQPPERMLVAMHGTGHELGEGGVYLGSLVQLATFVWHFYAYPVP